MKPRKLKIIINVLIFILFTVFVAKGVYFLDPDFGWRLRSGEYFINNGVPETDIYTYTMPSFPWVDHAWMFDVLIAKIYAVIGMIGLSVFTALLSFAAIFLSVKRADKLPGFSINKIKIVGLNINPAISFVVILAYLILLTFFGIRAQVTTWLFFAAFIFILLNKKLWTKWRILTPLYFLVWTNLHGGFVSGLIAFSAVVMLRSFSKRNMERKDLGILLVSILATLINPYGVGIWREVWSSMSDASLRWTVVEWRPAFFFPDFSLVFLFVLSSFLVFRYRLKYSLEELGLFILYSLFGLSSMRNIPLWLIIALPISLKGVYYLSKEAKKIIFGRERFLKVLKILWGMTVVVALLQIFLATRQTLRLQQSTFYPENAVYFLNARTYKGEMFSTYGWGGYLIWKYPEKKVFIDGRMPSWRRNNATSGELPSAFDSYNDILNGRLDYKILFEQFDVHVVLWPKKAAVTSGNLENKARNLFKNFNIPYNDFDLVKSLDEEGWYRVYEDETAVVLSKTDD